MHIYLDNPALTDCPTCGEKALRHHMCKNCGHYKGRQVVDVMEDLVEGKKKEEEKEEDSAKEGPLDMENLSTK